jgi:hypothetical protein
MMKLQQFKSSWLILFFVVFTIALIVGNWLNPKEKPVEDEALVDKKAEEVSSISAYQTSIESNPALLRKKNANPKPFDKPHEASDFYIEKRLGDKNASLSYARYQQAIDKIKNLKQYQTKFDRVMPSRFEMVTSKVKSLANSEISAWETVGPGNIGGRTRSLLVHPSDSSTMYIGGVAGGVWKTIDGGSWLPLTDLMTNIAITALVFKSDDPNTIYAGTGEGFYNADSVRGDGIFVSNDAGVTWSQLSATASNSDFRYVNKLVASSQNPNTLYAATRTGVHRSIDSGATWSQVYSPSGTSVGCTDLVVRNDLNPDVLITSCGSFSPGHVARSADGGDTWTSVLTDSKMGRSVLAISPSEQNVIYALNATSSSGSNNMGNHGLNKVFRSNDGGVTWATQFDVDANSTVSGGNVTATGGDFGISLLSNTYYAMLNTCSPGSGSTLLNQGWYDMAISVDPLDSNKVWAGGIDLFRSDDAGATWGLTSFWWFNPSHAQYAHADQHIQAFDPQFDGSSNTTFYVGNDGGIQKTTNARANTISLAQYCSYLSTGTLPSNIINWTGLNNGYGVTQFYDGTPYPNNTSYVGGTQDNGTILGSDASGINGWSEIRGGDGGYVAVDPTNTDILFSSYVNLSLQKSIDGGSSWSDAVNGITGDGFPFITTYIMDQNDSNRLWILGNAIWRTDDQADNWSQASTDITGGHGTAVAVATGNSNRVMVGTSNGQILTTTDASNTNGASVWTTTQVVTGGRISGVTFDPNDQNIAYATSSTFGQDHVYKSIDGGITWSAIDNRGGASGIPDIPAHSVVVDPTNSTRVFVGTDLGLFVTKDNGVTWMVENSGFANTVTETLKINNGKLWAFTHGRGVFKADLLNVYGISNADYDTDEDIELVITVADMMAVLTNDSGSDAIQFVSLPANGVLTHAGEELAVNDSISLASLDDLTYTPSANFNGSNNFTWFGSLAGEQQTSLSTATLTVNSINDTPTTADMSVTTDEDVITNIVLTSADADGEELTLSIQSSPTKGVLTGNLDNLTYTPNANANGADSFTFVVEDATSQSALATASITITPVNDAPVIANLTLNIDEDSSGTLSGFATDVDGDSLTLTITTAPTKGTTSGDISELIYTPTANINGSDSFTYTVSDGALISAQGTASITINAINDMPVATSPSISTDEDTPLAITELASDPDGDDLSIIITISPQNGSMTGELTSLTYTPDSHFNGSDSFTYRVNDGSANSTSETVTITVNPINDAPITSNADIIVSEDQSVQITDIASDVDGDDLSINIITNPSNGSISGSLEQLIYTPSANISGEDSIVFTVSDGLLISTQSTINITILPVNDAPIATGVTASVDEDSSVVLSDFGSDVEGDSMTLVVLSQPDNGTISGDINGLTYTPDTDFTGTERFNYQLSDGQQDSETASIQITINPVNDPPTVADVLTIPSATVDSSYTYNVAASFSDIDGDSLTYSATGLGSGAGSGLSISSTGVISGNPTTAGNANVTVTANDGQSTASTSFNIIVSPKPKKSGGGSMGMMMSVMLAGFVVLRRRFYGG